MKKGSIQQEDTTLVNIYAPDTGAPKYAQPIFMDIKGGIDSNTVTVGDFNAPLTPMGRSPRPPSPQKNRETEKERERETGRERTPKILPKNYWKG